MLEAQGLLRALLKNQLIMSLPAFALLFSMVISFETEAGILDQQVPGHPSPTCASILSSGSSGPRATRLIGKGPAAQSTNLEKIKNSIDVLNATLLEGLLIPDFLEVAFNCSSSGCCYTASPEIELPSNRPEDILLPISTHEYGHEIFNRNLSRYLPEWRAHYELSDRVYRAKYNPPQDPPQDDSPRRRPKPAQWVQWFFSINKSGPDHPKTAMIDELSKRIQTLGDENALMISTNRLSILKIQRPYSELFADLVAVVAARDLQAISRSTRESGRDFSANISPVNWRETEEHHYFNPVRSFIGTHYLARSWELKRMSSFLARAYHTIVLEMLATAKEYPNTDSKNLDPELLNTRLIHAFKREFSDFESPD